MGIKKNLQRIHTRPSQVLGFLVFDLGVFIIAYPNCQLHLLHSIHRQVVLRSDQVGDQDLYGSVVP